MEVHDSTAGKASEIAHAEVLTGRDKGGSAIDLKLSALSYGWTDWVALVQASEFFECEPAGLSTASKVERTLDGLEGA